VKFSKNRGNIVGQFENVMNFCSIKHCKHGRTNFLRQSKTYHSQFLQLQPKQLFCLSWRQG
jgi:hypothetical protein